MTALTHFVASPDLHTAVQEKPLGHVVADWLVDVLRAHGLETRLRAEGRNVWVGIELANAVHQVFYIQNDRAIALDLHLGFATPVRRKKIAKLVVLPNGELNRRPFECHCGRILAAVKEHLENEKKHAHLLTVRDALVSGGLLVGATVFVSPVHVDKIQVIFNLSADEAALFSEQLLNVSNALKALREAPKGRKRSKGCAL